MHRYPPRTIYRYLGLPSTQIIWTHNSHKHNTILPLKTLVQAPYPIPTYITHTTATQIHRHTSNTPPVPTGLVKPKPLALSPPLHPRRPEPNTYTYHTLHQLLIPRTTTTPHSFTTPALLSPSHPHTLSINTFNTNNSTRITVTATTAST